MITHTNNCMAKAASEALSKMERRPKNIHEITREECLELFARRDGSVLSGDHNIARGYRQQGTARGDIFFKTTDGICVRATHKSFGKPKHHIVDWFNV